MKETIPVAAAGPMTLLMPQWLPGNHAPRGQIEKLTGGEDLEGRGVDPDIFVEFPLPFLAGRDPLLDRATALLSSRGAPARRRRL